MRLWPQLQHNLSQTGQQVLEDVDGGAWSGPQLLQLVRWRLCTLSTVPWRLLQCKLPHAATNAASARSQAGAAACLVQAAATSAPRQDEHPTVCGIFLSNSAAYVVAALAALQLG